jgi:hypothetical protein
LNHGSFDSDTYAAGYHQLWKFKKLTEDSSIASEAGVCGCASLSFLLLDVDTIDRDCADLCRELRIEEAKRDEHGWDSKVVRDMVV